MDEFQEDGNTQAQRVKHAPSNMALDAIGNMDADESAMLTPVTKIPNAPGSTADKTKVKRPVPLYGLYGEVLYGRAFKPSRELLQKEDARYKEQHMNDIYDQKISEIEDGLCKKLRVRRPEESPNYVPNTMGNGKNTDGNNVLVMGTTVNDPQHQKMWGLSQLDRTFHTFCLGSTGSGKSTFLRGLFVQDMWAGRGGLLLEPHGDLSVQLLDETPPFRLHNTAFIDTLSDTEYSPGFNPLAVAPNASRDEHARAVQSVVSLISKHFSMDSGAVQLKKNLENALNALVWTPGATLLEIMDFYTNEDVRKTVLNCMPEGADKERIENAASNVKPADLGSLENRISVFQNNMNMKRMFGQSKQTINFYELMNEGYTIICPLNKGVSTDDSFRNFVGAYVISTIYHDSMRRASIDESDREIFPLFIDEFQNFAGDDVAGMLSECRKYGLPLVLANQYLGQLDGGIQSAVAQCGTKIYMKLTDDDAGPVSRALDNVTSMDLMNTKKFQSVVKTTRNSQSTQPFISASLNIDNIEQTMWSLTSSQQISALVREISHQKFMKKASDIDAEIELRHQMLAGGATKEQLAMEFC